LSPDQRHEEMTFHSAHFAADSSYGGNHFFGRCTQCFGPASNIGMIVNVDSFIVALPRRATVVGHKGWTQLPYLKITLV